MTALQVEVERLRGEREKLEEVAAVADKGTAKGRTYEEAVFEALDAIAVGQGDDCDAVGDLRGVGGRKGDVVVAIDACAGPARGRIVFEAKNSKLSKNVALAELDEALAARAADYGVLVVPAEDKLPARTRPLREFNGDKLFVVYDPEEGSRLALEVAYGLARARVLMARGQGAGRRRRRAARGARARPAGDGGRAPHQVAADQRGHRASRRRAASWTRWPAPCAGTCPDRSAARRGRPPPPSERRRPRRGRELIVVTVTSRACSSATRSAARPSVTACRAGRPTATTGASR